MIARLEASPRSVPRGLVVKKGPKQLVFYLRGDASSKIGNANLDRVPLGAHRLARVRVADLNGELSVQRLAALAKMPGANSSYVRQAA